MSLKEDGWYMPAEWTRHKGMIMQWPVEDGVFGDALEEAEKAYADVANKISEHEKVYMIVKPELEYKARKVCNNNVEFIVIPHDDSWARDSGPTYIKNKDKLAMVNWKFNSWGQKFHSWEADNEIPKRLSSIMGVQCFDIPIVLEGGSIHTNGCGTILTTKECLLNPNRNPDMTQTQIEKVLLDTLGAKKVVWLEYGIYGDTDTDGHVDNVACFVNEDTVLIQVCEDKNNPNYERSKRNVEILWKARLNIIKIHQPPVTIENGVLYPLSYINFVYVNDGIVMPVFGGACKWSDEAAVSLMKDIFPHRKIMTVDGMAIIRGGGNVHCITQQIPEV